MLEEKKQMALGPTAGKGWSLVRISLTPEPHVLWPGPLG